MLLVFPLFCGILGNIITTVVYMSGAKQNKTVLSRVRKTKRGYLLILGKGRGAI